MSIIDADLGQSQSLSITSSRNNSIKFDPLSSLVLAIVDPSLPFTRVEADALREPLLQAKNRFLVLNKVIV